MYRKENIFTREQTSASSSAYVTTLTKIINSPDGNNTNNSKRQGITTNLESIICWINIIIQTRVCVQAFFPQPLLYIYVEKRHETWRARAYEYNMSQRIREFSNSRIYNLVLTHNTTQWSTTTTTISTPDNKTHFAYSSHSQHAAQIHLKRTVAPPYIYTKTVEPKATQVLLAQAAAAVCIVLNSSMPKWSVDNLLISVFPVLTRTLILWFHRFAHIHIFFHHILLSRI